MRTPDLYLFALLTLAFFAAPASAQVFKCKQSSGLIVYSDKPCEISTQTTDVRLVRSSEEAEEGGAARGPEARKPVTIDGNASTLLRAIGPDLAVDSKGNVFKRSGSGYLDRQGNYVVGVARGHR